MMSISPHRRPGAWRNNLGVFGLLLSVALWGSCSTDIDLASRRDGGVAPRSYEECGNGMDDDGDGRLDEGCPCRVAETQRCYSGVYPNRLIGACGDGQQRCEGGSGQEFGSWATCIGDARPGSEVCEGAADEDCDGAIDEGCACEGGGVRGCSESFTGGVCVPGTQHCTEAGLWSACEGAIGPAPELCTDALDNDCDGLVNEGCECIPDPEICGDGLDNDCDGQRDEGGCATEPFCPGFTGGCAADGLGPWQVTGLEIRPPTLSGGNGHQMRVERALGSDWAAIYLDDSGPVGEAMFRFALLDSDAVVHTDVVAFARTDAERFRLDDWVRTTTGYVVAWTEHILTERARAHLARLSAEGVLVGAVRDLGPQPSTYFARLLAADASVFVAYGSPEGSRTLYRLGEDLEIEAGPWSLGINNGRYPGTLEMGWSPRGQLVVLYRAPTVRVAFFEADALVREVSLGGDGFGIARLALVLGQTDLLACWYDSEAGGHLCRRVSLDGAPLGEAPFPMAPGALAGLRLTRSTCEYQAWSRSRAGGPMIYHLQRLSFDTDQPGADQILSVLPGTDGLVERNLPDLGVIPVLERGGSFSYVRLFVPQTGSVPGSRALRTVAVECLSP